MPTYSRAPKRPSQGRTTKKPKASPPRAPREPARFVQERPLPPGLGQRLVDSLFNNRNWFKRIIDSKRRRLLASKSREELGDQLWRMHKWLLPLYMLNLPGTRRDWNAVKRLEFFKCYGSGRILDIGCEDGFFVRELRKAGLDAEGMDTLEVAVRHCRKKDPGGRYFTGYAERMDVPDGRYDTAILSHVLEHVYAPAEVLREAARVLRPGGRLLVVVPFGYGNEPNHLRAYTRHTLATEVEPWFTLDECFDFIGNGFGLVARKRAKPQKVAPRRKARR